ncbi:MAG: metallophosphoesterase family protein [Verrucomicrobiota bacterium]|nr:metallophosphoesterase family protein [Verrucomicrobiota bacterium]
MKLGLISDTHGHVPNAVHTALAGVDCILHAGDVGPMHVITELEAIAPVRAVLGNTDYEIQLPETRLEKFCGKKIMIHHILDVDYPSQTVRAFLKAEKPDIVLFGHTHVPFDAHRNGIRFINPGSASRPRARSAPSVAILDFLGGATTLQSVTLVE